MAAAHGARGRAMIDQAGWLDELPWRPLVLRDLAVRFALQPGDRPLVVPGDRVTPGTALLERLRDRRVEEISVPDHAAAGAEAGPAAGSRWATSVTSRLGRHGASVEGELVAPSPGRRDRWRIIAGDHRDVVESPVSGVVDVVRPGGELVVRADGVGIRGALGAGSPAHGPLDLATDPFGALRPGGIDVGRAGSILVVGERIDVEALTRARAMGVRGIVVASVSGKDLRDFQASERRQRASLHAVPPFGVVALEGTRRRVIPSPVTELLTRLAGRQVGLTLDPPALVFDEAGTELPTVDPQWVCVRSGPNAGAEGRLIGPAGLRSFAGGVQLEAALVALGDEAPIAVPIGDLERLV